MSEIALTPEQEAADAEALQEALQERIMAGDLSVTPDELDRARSLAGFARLRAAAAARRAEEERQARELADAEAHVAAVVKRAGELVSDAPSLEDLLAGAIGAVRAYLDAARVMHDGLREVATAVVGAESLARDKGIESPAERGCGLTSETAWAGKGSDRREVRLGDYATRNVIRALWEGAELGTLSISGEPQLKAELRDYHHDHNRSTFEHL